MKTRILWFLFFLVCMGVGFLHGVLPHGLSKSVIISPEKIQVITTDAAFFPEDLQKELEAEMHVKFSVTVSRDWESLLAHTVASPGVDLLLLPSFWAHTLAQQTLLLDLSNHGELAQRIASDFLGKNTAGFFFLPFYWMKTHIQTPDGSGFQNFLKNKQSSTLFLLADEDLLLKHFQTWKEQGLLDQINQKKILTMQLDQLLAKNADEGAIELPLKEDSKDTLANLSALLVWGAAIPQTSEKKDLVLEILDTLATPYYQEKYLLKTPFNSTFATVTGDEIPLQRRAEYIRNLQLKDILILEKKDFEAKQKLKSEFNFTL
ncbi:hypothetical protein ACES2L_08265 [Bdellovibrio bacteriovorus]